MSVFTPTERSQVRRRPQRAAYGEATVNAVLDAGVMAHVGYVIDGQPYVTPTAYWREGAPPSGDLAPYAEGARLDGALSDAAGRYLGLSVST